MKKYYTKYLPIEGEIKVGEICLITDEDGLIGFLPFKQIYVDEGGIPPKKVELFVCSRDIKIGDHAMELLTTGEYDTFQIDTENDIYDDMIADGRQFKVIGKVSKKATWVKGGDEYYENELFAHGVGVNWCKDGEPTGLIYTFKVKGPCGHFH
jgi:hypothetical protein